MTHEVTLTSELPEWCCQNHRHMWQLMTFNSSTECYTAPKLNRGDIAALLALASSFNRSTLSRR